MGRVNVLIVSKGHDFNHDAFLDMFTDMDGIQATLVQQPAAQVLLRPENIAHYDAVLFYDMSGIPGIGLLHDGANDTGIPPDGYRASIEALVERGTGLVLLNHATVSWPLWPLWRQISGTSFMLQRGELDGVKVPGSGYRGGHGPFPNPSLRLVPQCEHPVLDGLQEGFEITDEIYLKTAGFESRVTPFAARCIRLHRRELHAAAAGVARRTGTLEAPARQQPDRLGQSGQRKPRCCLGCRGRSRRVRESRFPPAARQRPQMGGVR